MAAGRAWGGEKAEARSGSPGSKLTLLGAAVSLAAVLTEHQTPDSSAFECRPAPALQGAVLALGLHH